MHELLYAAAPAAAGIWWGAHRWLARRTVPVGSPAPAFTLPGTDGRMHSLADLEAPVVALLFMSNACPGVKAYDSRIRALQVEFPEMTLIGINPIDQALYPGESMAAMRKALRDRGLSFTYVKDAAQTATAAYGAICTPEVVVLDRERRIRYRGRIDDSLVASGVRKRYLRDAVDALLRGRRIRVEATAPLGCSIDASAANAIVHATAQPTAASP